MSASTRSLELTDQSKIGGNVGDSVGARGGNGGRGGDGGSGGGGDGDGGGGDGGGEQAAPMQGHWFAGGTIHLVDMHCRDCEAVDVKIRVGDRGEGISRSHLSPLAPGGAPPYIFES
eukprot:6805572-Prymnesium_polylepis.3